jgi:histone-lysine N-methyltransferase MLL3
MKVLEPIQELRKTADCIKIFPAFISGEDLFGLTEPTVIKVALNFHFL